MKTLYFPLARRHRIASLCLLLLFLICGFMAVAQLYTNLTAAQRATERYNELMDNSRISSLSGLVEIFSGQQFMYIGVAPPGTEAWNQNAGPYPVDWEYFPSEMTKNLIGYEDGEAVVYDIYVFQDDQSREIVILNSDLEEIYSVNCPYGTYCSAEQYAYYRYPGLYSLPKDQFDFTVAHYDPARVGIWIRLVPSSNLYDYLYAQAQSETFVQAYFAEYDGGGGGDGPLECQSEGICALNDLDGDGTSNRDEIRAGTDPEDSNDFFRITSVELGETSPTNWLDMIITWPSVSNREYSLQISEGDNALDTPQNWSAMTQWLAGTDADMVYTQDLTASGSNMVLNHVQFRETDANTNGLPDWWEIEFFGGLTNIAASGDEDGDGLNNLEEVYYGYDPGVSERSTYHSIFKIVNISNNVPSPGPDDGTEFFDFHGGGRPLCLASNGVDGFGVLAGDAFSGGVFFNSDLSNLYIGISGVKLAGPNAVAMFIDADDGGVTNLSDLSGAPYGFGHADNIQFLPGFTPEVGLLLGDKNADGRNYTTNALIGQQSWGLWAPTGSVAAAVRPFEEPLAVGQSVGIDLDNGWIESGYAVGVELRNDAGENRVGLIFRGGETNYLFQDSSGEVSSGLPWSGEGIRLKFTLHSNDAYTASAIGLSTGITVESSGALGGTAYSDITEIRIYNGGAGNGTNYDTYVNNLRIGEHFDSASDPSVPSWWDSAVNSGSGFQAWELQANGGGHFVGQSFKNAGGADSNSDRDIDGVANVGQGAWKLSDNSSFPGFSTSSDSPISQWARNYTNDPHSANGGIEVSLSLSSLGAVAGDTIKIAMVFLGDTDGTNRWVSPEVYGKSFLSSNTWGYDRLFIDGADLELADIQNTLPPNSYCGFSEKDVLFQGFYWDVPENTWWTNLKGRAGGLADAGFTMIWLPVPYKGASGGGSVGYDPFDHYDLGEYDQRGSVITRYGSSHQLTNELIPALIATNIMPICDIVPNHMAGGSGSGYKTFTYNGHTNFQKTADDFHPSGVGHNDELYPYHNNWNFGDPNHYPLDVDNLSPNMRLGFKKWGSWLVNSVGYQAFRFDFTEGVPPWVMWEWLDYPAMRGRFAFMEYWEEADGVEMHEWLELTGYRAAIYDWNLRDHFLKPMCEDNGSFDMRELESPSLLGRCPEWTVIIFDNHDTWREGDTTKLGISTNLLMALGYGIHSQGLPMFFYPHYYDQAYLTTNAVATGTNYFNEINRLIKIRQAASAGGVETLYSDTDLYIQLRTGSSDESASILAINDHPTTENSYSVQTPWTNTSLIDLFTTNAPDTVTTGTNGMATLGAPAQGFRIYAPTNVLSQVED